MQRLVLRGDRLRLVKAACPRRQSYASSQYGLRESNRILQPPNYKGEKIAENTLVSNSSSSQADRHSTISTLTPGLLTESDYLDLSGVYHLRLSFPLSGRSKQVRYVGRGFPHLQFLPFPPHARGFFYAGPQPGLPPLAASIRFRCTPSPFPSSFEAGEDLLRPSGLPWQILLGHAATAPSPVLRDQLLREGHLTPQSLDEWAARVSVDDPNSPPPLLVSNRTLFTPHQRFPVNFQRPVDLTVLRAHRAYALPLGPAFAESYRGMTRHPFAGAALAHFERNPTAPYLVHLRIATVFTPVDEAPPTPRTWSPARRMVPPRAGALVSFRHCPPGTESWNHEAPWVYDLRRITPRTEALRALMPPPRAHDRFG
ncbi:hypothetical protein DFH07DRAFT_987384 [Mycena maculata]|uniref:Uncharacterized protein n=1 Tax=Mycena maculata TaxID=230809 RepID=A0AAD7I6L9_9AGAR|nr:hypothetical protein DFH07DRAFT_987384 [Mycena maculata]